MIRSPAEELVSSRSTGTRPSQQSAAPGFDTALDDAAVDRGAPAGSGAARPGGMIAPTLPQPPASGPAKPLPAVVRGAGPEAAPDGPATPSAPDAAGPAAQAPTPRQGPEPMPPGPGSRGRTPPPPETGTDGRTAAAARNLPVFPQPGTTHEPPAEGAHTSRPLPPTEPDGGAAAGLLDLARPGGAGDGERSGARNSTPPPEASTSPPPPLHQHTAAASPAAGPIALPDGHRQAASDPLTVAQPATPAPSTIAGPQAPGLPDGSGPSRPVPPAAGQPPSGNLEVGQPSPAGDLAAARPDTRWPLALEGRPLPSARALPSQPHGDLKLVVLRRETHLPPIAQRGTMSSTIPFVPGTLDGKDQTRAIAAPRQPAPAKGDGGAIVAQIAQSLSARADAAPSAAASQPATPSTPATAPVTASAPVRVVDIQLHPSALGTITVSMRLSASGLKVSMSASVRETAQMLQEQRSELVELIRRAGYAASDVTIEQAAGVDSGADGDAGQPSSGDGRNAREERPRTFADQPETQPADRIGPRTLTV